MKIAITGEKGFLGIHLTNYFRHILKYEVVELGRDYHSNLSDLDELDWLIHGAFLHRSSNSNEILEENRKLTLATIEGLKKNKKKVNVVFLSSIQEDLNTPYGNAKKESRELLQIYCSDVKSKFVSYKLPNVFGRYAQPNKTSFVATFCYNLHNNLEVNYNNNIVKLNYVDSVVALIGTLEEKEINFTEVSVEEVYFKLLEFRKLVNLNQFPVLNDELELHLFQTYLDYTNYKV